MSLDTLTDHSAETLKENALVAVAGFPFPDELALALGLEPVRLLERGAVRNDEIERKWIDDKEESEVRSVFVAALRGDLADCHGLVTTRTLEHAHYFLREALRLGEWKDPRPLLMFDLMPLNGPGFREYNRRAVVRLANFLERISGRQLEASRLAEATIVTNAKRAQWRELADRRIESNMSGAEVIRSMQSGKTPSANPATNNAEGKRLMLVTSHAIYDDHLHALVEDMGWRVVAEDDGTTRFVSTPDLVIGDDALSDIANYYAGLPATLSHPLQNRAAHILNHAKEGHVDAVLFCAHHGDLRLGWDYPSLRRELAKSGVRSTLVHAEEKSEAGANQIRDAAKQLLDV